MRDKIVNRCFLILFQFWYKTQEIVGRAISDDPFMLVYCPDKYKTQIIYDECVDDCLAALKSIPNLFVINTRHEKFGNTYTLMMIHFFK